MRGKRLTTPSAVTVGGSQHFATSTVCFINSNWSSRRQAVDSSEWLGAWCGFTMSGQITLLEVNLLSAVFAVQYLAVEDTSLRRGGFRGLFAGFPLVSL